MNNHLRRIKEEETTFLKNRKQANRKTFYAIALCIAMYGFVGMIIPSDEPVAINRDTVDSWNLILINQENVLERDFTVKLEDAAQGRVDSRIAPQLSKMIAQAARDGVTITVESSYRSVQEQTALYEESMADYKTQGFNEQESHIQTVQKLQPPTASEHHTGLAVDLTTPFLKDDFTTTNAYNWLLENAVEYGFVERYPEGKQEMTKMSWNPYHYRYVGVAHSQIMKASSLCLEEYLQQIIEPKGNS